MCTFLNRRMLFRPYIVIPFMVPSRAALLERQLIIQIILWVWKAFESALLAWQGVCSRFEQPSLRKVRRVSGVCGLGPAGLPRMALVFSTDLSIKEDSYAHI